MSKEIPIPICLNCGEEHPEWYEDSFCCTGCKQNYDYETYYKD